MSQKNVSTFLYDMFHVIFPSFTNTMETSNNHKIIFKASDSSTDIRNYTVS